MEYVWDMSIATLERQSQMSVGTCPERGGDWSWLWVSLCYAFAEDPSRSTLTSLIVLENYRRSSDGCAYQFGDVIESRIFTRAHESLKQNAVRLACLLQA
jgi:hypothetical protein